MATAPTSAGNPPGPAALPGWACELIDLYQSNAASQFILHGNIHDRVLIPSPQGLGPATGPRLGTLTEFLMEVLLPRFEIVLSYDLGNGIRVERGGPIFSTWPYVKDNPDLPRTPRAAAEVLTYYFRYCANLGRIQQKQLQVACIVRDANLMAPPLGGGFDFDVAATSVLIRDWSVDPALTGHPLATFLLVENLNDINPLLANNTRCGRIKIGLPSPDEQANAYRVMAPQYPIALKEYAADLAPLAKQLAGATISAVERLFKTNEYSRIPLAQKDLVKLKKQIVEKDCNGLIEFIETGRTLDDVHGMENVKKWLRQDIALWKNNDVTALPKGYLICGPVGTGKTFMVECLAGEAGVPVVKLKNFRDKWVGSTEGNLERIFRLLQALGRCYVFVDEADQSLGKRDAGGTDSGLSGRVYGMIAEEMGSSANRGRIIWILASSRPDLIEIDLKRPGRVDVKIPLLPTSSPEEGFRLIGALCNARGVDLKEEHFGSVRDHIPALLTPGAAEALASKVYRTFRTENLSAVEAVRKCLEDYRPPVAPHILESQIRLAVTEATDVSFVPAIFAKWLESGS